MVFATNWLEKGRGIIMLRLSEAATHKSTVKGLSFILSRDCYAFL